MPTKPTTVNEYLEIGCGRCKLGGTPDCKTLAWTKELNALRKILQESDLTEELKWSTPSYTYNGKNVAQLGALKDAVMLSFFNGALLKDPANILEKPGENSRFARRIRITDAQSARKLKKTILQYVREAINNEEAGKRVDTSKDPGPDYPEELTQAFKADPKLKKAFNALTPGRQRGYLLHFNSAKQSTTRTNRIQKCAPKILAGKGWNER